MAGMNQSRGLTLLEVIVVTAILGLLVAIFYPVATRAIERTQVASSLSRLKQLHLAFELYRLDEATAMKHEDLPPAHYVYTTFMGLGKDFFRSPCGYKPGIEENAQRLSYTYWNQGYGIETYFEEYDQNAVIFSDPHCNASAQDWNSIYVSKRGLAVTISGQLVNHRKPGWPGRPDWWTLPP